MKKKNILKKKTHPVYLFLILQLKLKPSLLILSACGHQ